MSEITTNAELPAISADPLQQTVDHGFPLYRFAETSRHIKLHQENQLIPRTNEYKPTRFTVKKQLKPIVRYIASKAPELRLAFGKELTNILLEDIDENRKLEQMDPLKGNSLVVTDYLVDIELILFSAGPSLSSLVILTLSSDKMTIKDTIDLEYPIRQIQLSPLSTRDNKIFLVRTTSSLHLFEVNENQRLLLVHQLMLPALSNVNQMVDYSMPIHAELSPFNEYEYLFVTNNGYMALIDGSNDKIKFENVDPISESTNYKSRWRSCAFGITPFSIYITSPECVKEFIIRDTAILNNILATAKDNIVAFKTLDRLYCFATLTSIVVMDRLAPERPLLTWLHKMRDGPPTELLIDRLLNDQWRITAFSQNTQRFTMIFLHYVNDPIKNCKPTIKILEMHNFTLSILKFEEIFNYTSRINTMGCCIRQDSSENDLGFCIYRSFEDGSIRVQYIALQAQDTVFTPPPVYPLVSESSQFDKLMSDLVLDTIPQRNLLYSVTELSSINPVKFKTYLNDGIITGSDKISDHTKREIAEQVQNLKSATTFRDLFKEHENYTLEELNAFSKQMLIHEDIELARQIDIPGITHQGQTNLSKKLMQAHEKEIQLSKLIIRPLRENTDTFQYLDKDINFVSTTTSKACSDLWTVNDTSFNELIYPELNTRHVLKPEYFPSINSKKRKTIDLDPQEDDIPLFAASAPKKSRADDNTPRILHSSLDIPEASTTSNFAITSTQPLPGVFGSRVKKPIVKKKKGKKTSGFR